MAELVYEFPWDIDESVSTDEWAVQRVQYLPMHEHDKQRIIDNYDWNHEHCTQWLIYVSHYPDQDYDDSVVLIPCAPDKSSPWDTPFIEVYDVSRYDELVDEALRGVVVEL